jgi:hypothetical protein
MAFGWQQRGVIAAMGQGHPYPPDSASKLLVSMRLEHQRRRRIFTTKELEAVDMELALFFAAEPRSPTGADCFQTAPGQRESLEQLCAGGGQFSAKAGVVGLQLHGF